MIVASKYFKMKQFLYLFILVVLQSSCSLEKMAGNYVEDDIYFTNHSIHRINRGTISFNKDVAVPAGAVEYFSEDYASTSRPSYSKRLNQFDEDESPDSYFDEEEVPVSAPTMANQPSIFNNMGFTIGVGMAAMGTSAAYYNPYNPYQQYGYYSPRPVGTSYTSTEARSTRPKAGYNSRITLPSAPSTTTQNTIKPKIYTNDNPGYNTTKSTQYKTRGNNYYANPGYSTGGSRSGGSSPSRPSGAVRGAYRR